MPLLNVSDFFCLDFAPHETRSELSCVELIFKVLTQKLQPQHQDSKRSRVSIKGLSLPMDKVGLEVDRICCKTNDHNERTDYHFCQ